MTRNRPLTSYCGRRAPSGSPIPPAHREPVSVLNDLALASLESLDATPRLRGTPRNRRCRGDHKSGAATMPRVRRTYSAAEIAAEAGCPEERVRWLAEIGLLTAEHGRFRFGAVLAVKMVSALMETGITAETIEHAAAEGLLRIQRTDEFLPYEPGPRSDRTFAEFRADAGSRAELVPAVYEVLGLPTPDPSAPIHADEEAMLERFLQVWRSAPDEDSLLRAARLMAEGTRAAMLGWADLVDEQVVEPARRRLLRGELDEFPDEVVSRSRRRRGWCRRCSCG